MDSGVRRLSFSEIYFKEFDWMDEVNLEGGVHQGGISGSFLSQMGVKL